MSPKDGTVPTMSCLSIYLDLQSFTEEMSHKEQSSSSECSLESFCLPSSQTGNHSDDAQKLSGQHSLPDVPSHEAACASKGSVRREASTLSETNRRCEKLTLEDCIDMDVDVLTTVLERSFQSLKRDTLEFFIDARTRFKTRALNELSHERDAAESKESAKNEEIQLLEQDLQTEKRRNAALLDSLSRMASSVGSANQRKRSYRLILTVYQSWNAFARDERALKQKLQKALRYYCEEYLKRRALTKWVEFVREQHRTCARERFQTKLAVAREAVQTEFNEKLAAMLEENTKLKEKLKVENEARSKLEEDMQQAFMRGVCALNMEALSVMKRGMPPSGTNPFFSANENTSPNDHTTEDPTQEPL